ncbi:MAG: GntP family permease [Clostridium sp.]
MEITVTAFGAIAALSIAIFLIIKKVHPAYGLIIGAIIGGLIGGAGLTGTVNLMMTGAKGMMPAIIRIITAGVLAGVLIKSGAANKIAETIIIKIGESKALIALAIATMVLTSVGVFIDVAVITVSPIALAIAQRSNISKVAILIAMIGGGKAGNIMSPNPNAIAAADNLGVSLTSLMMAGIIPAIFGVTVTCIIAKKLYKKGSNVELSEVSKESTEMPSFFAAIVGPIVAIMILMLRPIAGIAIDPLIALPVGGICGALAMKKGKNINEYASFGIGKMSGVAILLIGTGTLAGIISNSALKDVIINGINLLGLPSFALAPISGILMSGATASTTSGTAVATSVFGPTITQLGVSSLATAAMTQVGATVLDHLPHGSFFHATGGSVNMDMRERLKLIPYESLIGLIMTIVSTIIFGFIIK